MTLTTLFFTAFVMGFSGAMMPGPLLTVDISESYRQGMKTGPLLVLGHAILELALVVSLTMGLYAILIQPLFKASVALLGGLVLLWMGWGMAKDAWLGKISLQYDQHKETRRIPPVLAGIIVSLSNPYWIIWWATIGLTYITQALQMGIIGLAVFLTGHLLADLTWYSAISFAVVSGKKIIKESVYRGILVVCGLFLLGLGAYFIYSAVNF